jgi:hypothetical protein
MVDGIHLLPLNTRDWPVVGTAVVRSKGMPWRFITRVALCVPPMSPWNAPISSHALRAWKAGMMSTSGVKATPVTVIRKRRLARLKATAVMEGMPVEPSTTP